MKKSLLSISFLAMSVASFAATYSGTLAGTVAGGELEAKVEVTVADGNEGYKVVTISAFDYTIPGMGSMEVGPISFEEVTAKESGTNVSYSGSVTDLKVGQVRQYAMTVTLDMTGTESGKTLSLSYNGTAKMMGSSNDAYFTFEGTRTDGGDESELPQGVYFFEDFEWLEPWSTAGNAGSTVENDDLDAKSPQIVTPKVDGVSALAALEAKGYAFHRVTTKTEGECIYLNKNYIKFGKTSYQAGISLPSIAVPAGQKVGLEFDWCPMRQGSGVIDPVNLIIIVKNGDEEKTFDVPTHGWENGHVLEWIHASVDLSEAVVDANSVITIRQTQWPKSTANRWFLDNVKLCDASQLAAIEDVVEDTIDANAPVEYYNIQGVRVNGDNLPAGLYIRRQGSKATKILVK